MQSARFLAAHFGDAKIAVNDIGAVARVGDQRRVDLMGLASLGIARAKDMKLDRPPSAADVARLTEGVDVAIVCEEWLADGLPRAGCASESGASTAIVRAPFRP